MTVEEIKQFVRENQKGLIIGVIAGFIVSRLLR
jgi:predicted negative regulator of RcsB-dependent stress response